MGFDLICKIKQMFILNAAFQTLRSCKFFHIDMSVCIYMAYIYYIRICTCISIDACVGIPQCVIKWGASLFQESLTRPGASSCFKSTILQSLSALAVLMRGES